MNDSQYTNARLHSMMSRPGQNRRQVPQRAWGFMSAGIVLLSVATVWQFELFGFASDAAYAQRPESAPAANAAEPFLPLISTAPGSTASPEADTAPFAAPQLPAAAQRPPQAFTRTTAATTATAQPVPAPTANWAEARDPFSAAPVQVAEASAPAMAAAPIQQVQQTTQTFDLFAAPAVETPAQSAETKAAPAAVNDDPFFSPPAVQSAAPAQVNEPAATLAPLSPPAAQQNDAFFTDSAAEPKQAPAFAPPAVESAPAQQPAAQPDPFGFAPVETARQSAPAPAMAPPAMAPQTFTEDPYLNRPAPLAPLDRPTLSVPPATGVSMNQPAIAEERIYEVQSGDNYWSISRYFYGTPRYFSALAEYNRHRIPDPNKMRPGMKVLGPDASILHDRYPKLTGPDPSKPSVQQPSGFFVDQNGQPAFRVGKGDTLTSIAQMHLGRVSRWSQVYSMNQQVITDPNNLKIDTILRLPADACQVQVVSGDSLLR